jgi:hypothetical protein
LLISKENLYFDNPYHKLLFGKYCGKSLIDVFTEDREYIDGLIEKRIIAVRGSAYIALFTENSKYNALLKKKVK